ncbi:MAG: TonB-dependent receptor plug domain-containing protein, partial [Gammaproteobacteria bacterium]|nr:TonB-dependent receptor plug domain-containing protein [Gammaproteobacteria bacterium]
MRRYNLTRILACVSGIPFALPAAAQQSRSDPTQLEEVVVTAQKRETTAQTTPVSLTAFSGADIQDRGFTDLSALVQSAPGVSIRTSGPGMAEFEMRGVASVGGNSPTVGFYYDETPLTSPAATNEGKIVISPALYDLNRVEVLRGPQGTLYGSGSMGGTIKVVPNPPNPAAFDASAEATFGDTAHGGFDHSENAMVNLPFGGGLGAVRLVGSYSSDSGWVDRVVIAPGDFPNATGAGCAPFTGCIRGNVLAAPVATVNHDVNNVDRTTVRVSALLKPVDGLTIMPSIFYETLRAGGLPYIDSIPGTNATYQPFDVAESYHDTFKLGALTAKYSTGAIEISSTTSYWSRSEPLTQDTTESWTTAFGLTSYLPAQGGLGPSYALEYNPSHQTTEELRVASVGDSQLKWLLGYFYSDFYSAWNIVFPSTAPFLGSTDLFSYFTP